MPPSWRTGLVNAFPIPEDRLKSKKGFSRKAIDEEVSPDSAELDVPALPGGPFKFFELPAEIRNKIYGLILFGKPGYRGKDGRKKTRTSILAVSRRMHQETSYILYSSLSFRIFPLQDFTPAPIIQELRPMYRAMVTKLEMVVGSSWASPPKTWRVSKLLARRLGKLSAVQSLRLFVQCDPSTPTYEKYRVSLNFYTDFCGDLLRDVLAVMPRLEYIEVDGNPGVDTQGPLVSRLLTEADSKGKTWTLGPTKPFATPEGIKVLFWV
ncbi:hypothetical protein H2204_000729 [Knufia peltigerae]|uniref:Uncharacterized protein n=1 Tax=Knufia peltigerae TaxID=1002370 RepID=A0AA39D3Y2_9EURO|nr:hypothetical protein H2204_000729 [Knufia peltigerae]